MRNPRNEPLADHDIAEATGSDNGPERRCILSGRIASRDELLRLAISPDGDVLPDAHAKAPGRGAWIGVTRAELTDAIANGKLKGALARAFKNGRLEIPENLPDLAEQALTRALLDRLGLEMRSGRLILGSDRIAGEARLGRVAALYHAADARDDGSRKLDQAWRVGSDAEGSGLSGSRLPLDRAALSVALGRDNVVHLALADAASAKRVSIPLLRLVNFLGAGGASFDEDACRAGDDAASASMATNEF
ncbi:MAG: DUF448 domain-containing protein [Porphyrobacter sp.]|nr:DUF448 domain-containing protein [Porphyrobacter sp.]